MKKILICILITFLSSSYLFSQQSISYNVSFSPYAITDTLYNDSIVYNKIVINDCYITSDVGKPVLPVKYVRLLIPRGTRATNVIINQTSNNQTQTLLHKVCYATPPIPIGESLENVEEGFDTIIYSQSTPFPTSRVSVVSQNFFRGNCIVTIAVYPILYTPSINQISYVSNISFSLNYVSDSNYLKDMYFDEKDRGLLSHMIDNPNIVTQFAPVNLSPASSGTKSISVNAKYLVVTERKLLPAFAELLDWKRRKGLPSQVVAIEDILADPDYQNGDEISNINDDAGKLRQFLYETYNNGNGVEYVLLAGANIPIRLGDGFHNSPNLGDNVPTDLYFSDFDGHWNLDGDEYYGEEYVRNGQYREDCDSIDLFTEIYIGRIMARNEWEVRNWTRKLIIYEQNPGNGTYLTKAFFTIADQFVSCNDGSPVNGGWFGGSFDYSYRNYYSDIFTQMEVIQENVDNHVQIIPTYPKGRDAISAFNNNYGFTGFLGHGSPNRIAVATKGFNKNEPNSKYFVTSFDSDYSSYMVEQEAGNGLDNMTNYCYPTIFLTTACTTMPFDNYDQWGENYRRNFGDMYTCGTKGGGHIYIGNTRAGYDISNTYARNFIEIANDNLTFNIGKMKSIATSPAMPDILHYSFGDYYFNTYGLYTIYSLNLMGCPETELWTEIPEHFNNVSIQENSNSLFVNAGVNDVSICVMSALDNGESYYQKVENVSSFNFQNISKPYNLTITKHNYYPYLDNPNDLYIQNINWDNERVISANKFFIGTDVTNTIPSGNVIINAPANILLKTVEDVIIQFDFEVVSGASFEIKINNSDENTCL
ncbi:MAG: hypothetical protein H6Q16_1822 [Bacteroidetes bacterium]|nr:hypothetical protein [Bacteroidota bacterium]